MGLSHEHKLDPSPIQSPLPLNRNGVHRASQALVFIMVLTITVNFVGANYHHSAYKCVTSQTTTSCNLRTGNLLIGRESHVRASSTCGLSGPQQYCSKDRRCYTCDSRTNTTTNKPLYPLLDHRIGNVIKRRRYGRQHNVTYARQFSSMPLSNTSSIDENFDSSHHRQILSPQSTSSYSNISDYDLRRWWQAENGAENVTIQFDLENEFLFTHLIMHFNSFYPAQASIERSFDFGQTWQVYQYYATNCGLSYPHAGKGPKKRVNETICEDLPSLEPSDDGELVLKVLAPTPSYVVDRERTLVEALASISTFSEELLKEYQELKQIMRVTNLRIRLLKLQTLGDELYGQYNDENGLKDERIKEIYHFGLNDLFVYGSCSCNGHSDRCIKKPSQISDNILQVDGEVRILKGEDDKVKDDVEDMIYGYCECEHNTEGANCHKCQDLYNDWPWRPAGLNQSSECRKCQCNNHARKCQFDLELFRQTNYSSGGICLDCAHHTRGYRCHLCELGYFKEPEKDIDELDACQACRCHPDGTVNASHNCYQNYNVRNGSLSEIAGDPAEIDRDLKAIQFYSELQASSVWNNGNLQLGQCLCKPKVEGVECNMCLEGYFGLGLDDLNGCKKCICYVNGTIPGICDAVDGKCVCKDTVTGPECDTCVKGFYGLKEFGECRPCECNVAGSRSIDDCNTITGQCMCKEGIFGKKCDQCPEGFWSYPECKPCTCNEHAKICDQTSGECIYCGNFTKGPYCDECLSGYYGQPILPASMNSSQSSHMKSLIINNDPSAPYIPCSACSCPGTGPESPEYHAAECHIRFSSSSSSIIEQRRQPFSCVCKPGFVGPMCELCADNYWGPNQHLGKDCRLCDCNNNWNISEVGNCHQDTGKCLKCLYNTEGDHCELCGAGYYGDATKNSCSQCQCNVNGTKMLPEPCDRHTGECHCAAHVEGYKCDKCQTNYWNIKPGVGCEECDCDPLGTMVAIDDSDGRNDSEGSIPCDPINGQCQCKSGFSGRRCNECGSGFWGDPKSSKRCKPCLCNMYASVSNDCDKVSGICSCLPGMTGAKCEFCAQGYYFNRTSRHPIITTNNTEMAYEDDLLNVVPSPKTCLACGECYDQWRVKITSLSEATNGLELKFRQSIRNRHQQSSYTSISENKHKIDGTLQSLAKMVNNQKLLADRFTSLAQPSNEIMNKFANPPESQLFAVKKRESEASDLLYRVDYLEQSKQLLIESIDQVDKDRIKTEAQILEDSFDQLDTHIEDTSDTVFLYKQIDHVYDKHREVITNTTALYHSAIESIKNSTLDDYNHLYRPMLEAFKVDWPPIITTKGVNDTMEKEKDPPTLMSQKAGGPIESFIDRRYCVLSNWHKCSTELKLLQRLIRSSVESALDSPNVRETCDNFLKFSLQVQRDHEVQLRDIHEYQMINNLNESISSHLSGTLNTLFNKLVQQSRQLATVNENVKNFIDKSRKQAPSISHFMDGNIVNQIQNISDERISKISAASTWREINKTLVEELWPKWNHLNDTHNRLLSINNFDKATTGSNLVSDASGLVEELVAHIDSATREKEIALNENQKHITELGIECDILDKRYKTLLILERDNSLKNSLAVEIISETNEALRKLNEQTNESHISGSGLNLTMLKEDLQLATLKLNKASRLDDLVVSNKSKLLVGLESRPYKQVMDELANHTANDAFKWWSLRKNFDELRFQLELDFNLVSLYDKVKSDMESRGEELRRTLEILALESKKLNEDIEGKWSYYEKCQS